jgi:hypothetical protein
VEGPNGAATCTDRAETIVTGVTNGTIGRGALDLRR